MATAQNSPDRPDDEVDLHKLFGPLVDNRWLIISITALFMVVSVAYAILGTPVYRANAIVQVEQKVPELPGLSAITQTLGASGSEATTEIALITSRSVIGRAVDQLGFDIEVRAKVFPMIGGFMARHYVPKVQHAVAPARFGLARYNWGGAVLEIFELKVSDELAGKRLTLTAGEQSSFFLSDENGTVLVRGKTGLPASGNGVTLEVATLSANPGTQFTVIDHDHLATISELQEDVKAVERGKDSGIIDLTYNNADPALAVRLLDQVSKFYVRQNVDRNSAEAANSLAFVKEQLPKIRLDLEQATDALNAYQRQAHSVDITMQTKGLLDQEVAIETSLQTLRMQQAELARRYTTKHPAYKALMEQIGQTEARKADMEKQAGMLPDTQQELLRLTRDVKVSNETYTSLLNQGQQLDIARAGTVGNARIIDPAAVDRSKPVAPKKVAIALGGTLLGAFLAIAVVLVRQMLNRGVEDPAAIEQLGLPVYASIPLSLHQSQLNTGRGRRKQRTGSTSERPPAPARQAPLLAIDDPLDLAIEAIRSLRTSLHFAMLEAKNNVLMISGASPSAGKTFISSNLAVVIAQTGQRVLLVDGDMRRGTLHHIMGGAATPGLSDVLSENATLADALLDTPVKGLKFISRGNPPPNPSELLMHANFTAFIKVVSHQFDLVIVDTPPILAVTDAAIIGGHAGTSLLVARFGVNQPRILALAKKRFELNRVELKGAIFNAVQRKSAGFYDYEYYQYRNAT